MVTLLCQTFFCWMPRKDPRSNCDKVLNERMALDTRNACSEPLVDDIRLVEALPDVPCF